MIFGGLGRNFGSLGASGKGKASSVAAPVNSVAPAVSGNRQFGQTLSTTTGTWTGSPSSYAYQWKRNGSDIASATASSYVLAEADAGQAVTCAVIATNGVGPSSPSVSNSSLIDVYVVYLTQIVDATDATTYSGGVWNGVSLGVAAANRKIVAGISTRGGNVGLGISAATIAGVSGLPLAVPAILSDSTQNVAMMLAADVPTGTTGNISVTWGGAATRQGMGLWAVYGAQSSSPNDFGTTAVDATAVNLFALPGSVVIGYSFINSNTPAWTGITQDFAGAVETTLNHSGSHASFASGVLITTALSVDWVGALAPSTLFAAFSPAQTATVDSASDVVVADGVRTWFNTPSTILVGGNIYAGAVSQAGEIVLGKAGVSPVVFQTIQVDDHDNPALLRRSSDGRILAGYSNHNGSNNYYIHVSTNPDDASAFGAASNIGSSLGTPLWGYGNLVEVTDGIFNFVRGTPDGANWTQYFTKSTDNGATWSAVTAWFGPGANRPYFQMVKNGANRFDIFSGDANPNEGASGIYHFYYDAGTWKKSDGTSIGSPPFTTSQFTKIWDATTVSAWAWDAKAYSGAPVIVYATFPVLLNHQYRYARWNGAAWVDNFICNGGSTIYSSAGLEDRYSGGVCLDPDDINTIYCSRKVAGVHQLFKGVTADGGVTWTLTQLTFGATKRFRPQKLAGISSISYLAGSYTDFVTYATAVRKLAV